MIMQCFSYLVKKEFLKNFGASIFYGHLRTYPLERTLSCSKFHISAYKCFLKVTVIDYAANTIETCCNQILNIVLILTIVLKLTGETTTVKINV